MLPEHIHPRLEDAYQLHNQRIGRALAVQARGLGILGVGAVVETALFVADAPLWAKVAGSLALLPGAAGLLINRQYRHRQQQAIDDLAVLSRHEPDLPDGSPPA